MHNTRKERIFLCALFFFALALRIGYLIFLKHNYLFFEHPSDDVAYYQSWAKTIAAGDWLGTNAFSGMPLFPYYLALVFRICLGSWFAANIFNLILGSLNCLLIYFLAKKLLSTRAAVLASLLAATNFVLIYYDWLMMPVTLLITLSLAILLAFSDERPKSVREWFWLGLFIGLAALGDGKFLIFAVLLIGYMFWSNRTISCKQILRIIFPLILGLSFILGAITVRNKLVSGEWIFITSQSGLSLYVGNNPQATGAFENPEFIRPSHKGQDEDQKIFVEKTLGKKVSLSEVSDFYRNQALSFITAHPLEYLRLLAKKFILLVSDTEKSHDIDLILQRNLKLKLDINPYSLIFPLALLGMVIVWRTNQNSRFVVLLVASYILYGLIYFVTTRQRAPILPLLIIFEAFSFVWIAQKIHTRQYKTLLKAIAALVIFVILLPTQYLNARDFAFLNTTKAGFVYDSKKDYPTAIAAYRQALILSPTDSNTLFNLGTVYLNQNDYENARQCFLAAIKFGKFNVDATFNLGYIYEQTGETQNALNAYKEVLNLVPESPDALFRIASIYQKQGSCQEVTLYYEKLIALKPILAQEIHKTFSNCKNDK